MLLKYNIDINDAAIEYNLNRLTNQTYKLLPTWEEAADWKKPLATIIEEFSGMKELFMNYQEIFFSLLCKLEGLFIYTEDPTDFLMFRKTVFECLNLIGELRRALCH